MRSESRDVDRLRRRRTPSLGRVALAVALLLTLLAPPVHAEDDDPLLQAVLLADAAVDFHYARQFGTAAARLRSADAALAEAPDSPQRDALRQEVRYNLACALALAGEREAAMAALEQAVASGFLDRAHIVADKDLEGLRKHPRFVALVKTLERVTTLQAELDRLRRHLAATGVLASANLKPFELDAELVTGGRLRTGDLRGKVVVVDLWGSWCAPCLETLPRLQALSRKRPAQVAVVGLAFERGLAATEAAQRVREVVKIAGLTFPQALVPSGLLERIGAEGLPTLLLLDRRGRLRWVHAGVPDDEVLDALIEQLLAEPGRPK